jgi:hypothetical protein
VRQVVESPFSLLSRVIVLVAMLVEITTRTWALGMPRESWTVGADGDEAEKGIGEGVVLWIEVLLESTSSTAWAAKDRAQAAQNAENLIMSLFLSMRQQEKTVERSRRWRWSFDFRQ